MAGLRLREEKDIERLREKALLLESQMQHVMGQLARKCAELDKLKGGHSLQSVLAGLVQAVEGNDGNSADAKPQEDEPPAIVADVTRLRKEVGWQKPFDLRKRLEEIVNLWRENSAFYSNSGFENQALGGRQL